MATATKTKEKTKKETNLLEVERNHRKIALKSLDELKEGDIVKLSLTTVCRGVCIDPHIPSFIDQNSHLEFRYLEYEGENYIKNNAIHGKAIQWCYEANSGAGTVFNYLLNKSFSR